MKISVTIKFEGSCAHVFLSDGTTWTKPLAEGQTEQEFCDQIDTLLRETLGDKIRKITTRTEYAR